MAVAIDLAGRSAVVFGVANQRSIAWAIAQQLHTAGANLTVTYQNERMGRSVLGLVEGMERTQAVECDVLDEESVVAAVDAASSVAPLAAAVHSVAFANRDDLEGAFSRTGVDGFRTALEVSAYSLLPVARAAGARMTDGGSILTLTFHAADKVYPGYNVMGVAKAALENEVESQLRRLATAERTWQSVEVAVEANANQGVDRAGAGVEFVNRVHLVILSQLYGSANQRRTTAICSSSNAPRACARLNTVVKSVKVCRRSPALSKACEAAPKP